MNIVQQLLKLDAKEIKMPTGTHKMFCKKLGQEMEFPIKAIDAEKVSEIQEKAIDLSKGEVTSINTFKLKTNTIIEGCDTFRNKELMAHFNTPTPVELLRKLLLSGEMNSLNNAINELNGVKEEKETTDEIKN